MRYSGAESARRSWRAEGPILLVVAVGGGLGAVVRWGCGALIGSEPGGFPWSTFVVNVFGCFLMGIVMVSITELRETHRWVRAFVGVGVLGGFTTFSTYTVEVWDLLRAGHLPLAALYWGGTVLCALVAVVLGAWGTRGFAAAWKNRSRATPR